MFWHSLQLNSWLSVEFGINENILSEVCQEMKAKEWQIAGL